MRWGGARCLNLPSARLMALPALRPHGGPLVLHPEPGGVSPCNPAFHSRGLFSPAPPLATVAKAAHVFGVHAPAIAGFSLPRAARFDGGRTCRQVRGALAAYLPALPHGPRTARAPIFGSPRRTDPAVGPRRLAPPGWSPGRPTPPALSGGPGAPAFPTGAARFCRAGARPRPPHPSGRAPDWHAASTPPFRFLTCRGPGPLPVPRPLRPRFLFLPGYHVPLPHSPAAAAAACGLTPPLALGQLQLGPAPFLRRPARFLPPAP